MLRALKRTVSGAACILLLLPLTACGKENSAKRAYEQPEQMAWISTGMLAENDTYTLQWNDEKKCVLLTDKNTDYTWATVPFAHLQSGEYDYNLEAPLLLEYYDPYSSTIQSVSGIDCVDAGTIAAEQTEHGIKVTYYFSELKIAVPVSYDLREDSLSVSVNTEGLQESEDAQIVSISVTPYLCSVANSPESTEYLFIPSGSGALMYAKAELESGSRTFSGEVYGEDLTRMPLYSETDDESIRIPVFGARSGENAICAIIEQGASAARIQAFAGDTRLGYSNAYATFQIREYNITDKSAAGKIAEFASVSDGWPADMTYSVGYYPLQGEQADYNGMAALYRRYLAEKGLLTKSSNSQKSYLVNIVGGDQIKTFTLGIPHNTLQAATTFEQAKQMVEAMVGATETVPTVVLSGFGSTGVTPGQVAGGFTFASSLGGVAKHQVVEQYCRENGIDLYTDFDVLFFSKSGKGFNTLFDSAKCATLRPTYTQALKVNVRDVNTDKGKFYVLGRNQVGSAVEKLLDFCNGTVSGIGLSSFGQYSYSDYSDAAYFAQSGMAQQMIDIASQVKNSGHRLYVANANDYAAAAASTVSNVPTNNGNYDGLDEAVPFYALVFRGSVPLYADSLNTVVNAQRTLLKALEGGVAPSFTLAYEYDSQLAKSTFVSFYGTKFESNVEFIKSTVKQVSAFFEKTSDAQIVKHEILAEGVTKTAFDNGVAILINHTDFAVNVEGIEIAAMAFETIG